MAKIGNYNINEYAGTLVIDNGYETNILHKNFEVLDMDLKYICIDKGLYQFSSSSDLLKFITFVSNWGSIDASPNLYQQNKGV